MPPAVDVTNVYALFTQLYNKYFKSGLLKALEIQYIPFGLSSSIATMVAGGPVLESLHSGNQGQKENSEHFDAFETKAYTSNQWHRGTLSMLAFVPLRLFINKVDYSCRFHIKLQLLAVGPWRLKYVVDKVMVSHHFNCAPFSSFQQCRKAEK